MLFVEKYRPKTVAECILPERIKTTFQSFVDNADFPNLLLSGGAGTGKTTIAKALCHELDYDFLLINASDERNIELVRTTIRNFASTVSLSGKRKVIILDEADGLNKQSAQPALRAAIEEFSDVRFILTCNYKNKLIEPLHSRVSSVDFSIKPEERLQVSKEFLKRTFEILDAEKITYDRAAVAAVVKKYFPDNRKILNDLQRYSIGGTIDSGILAAQMNISDIGSLVKSLKNKNLGEVKKWIKDNEDIDTELIFKEIYDLFYHELTPASVPEFCIIIAQYQSYSFMVANQEINLMGMFCQMMGSLEFKQ